MIFDVSSCASSITLVESVTRTSNRLSNSDKSCAFLAQLPPHLLFRITAYLDIVSKICLQSTNHYFHNSTRVDRADLNTCARYLLARQLRQNPKTKLLATRFLCKVSRRHGRADRVQYLDEPQHKTSKWIAPALDRLPWVRRRNTTPDLSKEHWYRMSKQRRPKYWEPLMEQLGIHPIVESLLQSILQAHQEPAWLAFQVLRCTHCGEPIAAGDTRLQGCVSCKCDFCFRAPENYFRRCGRGTWSEPRPDRQIYEDRAAGQIYVMEGSGKQKIFVPVYNPFCLVDRTRLLDKHTLDIGPDEKRDAQIREVRWCEGLDSWGKECQIASI